MPDAELTLIEVLDIKTNEGVELFQEFSATLLQIPGTKYNIGCSYEGRKENKEFIFFGYSFEKEQDFQINVDKKGSFWIRRESGHDGLSVNSTPLKRKKAYKLTSSDTIEINFTNPCGAWLRYDAVSSSTLKCLSTLEKRWKKFEDDLLHFLPLLSGNIKGLVIKEVTECHSRQIRREYLLINEVFKALSPGLESVQFSDQHLLNAGSNFTEGWSFQDLKFLKVKFTMFIMGDLAELEPCAKGFAEKLGAQKLEVYEGLGGPFFQEIFQKGLSHLSSVSLWHLRTSDLEKLKGLNPLKTLSLFGVTTGDVYPRLLSDVLEGHCQSLETLVLFLGSDSCLIFPSFQRLEELTFICGRDVRLEGPVKYSYNFPALKKLTLTWTGQLFFSDYLKGADSYDWKFEVISQARVLEIWNENSQVFDSFFPRKSEQVGETLRSLSIPHLNPVVELDYAEQNYFKRVGKLRKMFPNCRTKWFNRNFKDDPIHNPS